MKTKIHKENVPPVFNPCSITLTFESQQELDAFGTLFNHARLTDSLAQTFGVNFDELFGTVVDCGGDVSTNLYKLGKSICDNFGKSYE